MKVFKPSSITAAMIASGMAFSSIGAIAQEQTDNQADAAEVEVIQVSGIRASLMRAQAVKMDNTSIVEALSAEDIGKLPDTSVAESLARLPGLAGERRNGRTSGLSVRGFNENFVGTTLNGRELLGMGDNRGVEYDLYPSEIISNVVVYKTPEAGLLTQGVGGTVDLQTVKPLGAERTIALNLNYEKNGEDAKNPDFDNDGHRISFNFVDSFLNDRLGVALALASMETPRQEEQFRAWGYADVNLDSDRRDTDAVTASSGDQVLGGHDSFVRSAMLERDSIAAVIQFAPSNDLMIQFDALYIDFEENDVRRGLEEGGAEWGTADYNITGIEDGLVTSGYWDSYYSVVRNDARRQKAELKTFGLNVKYDLSENWVAELDVSTGDVDKNITDVESYSGTGRAGNDGRPASSRSWTMTSKGVMYSDHPTLPSADLTDPDLIRLAGPQAWGNPLFGSLSQDGFVNEPVFEESLDSLRLQARGTVDWGIVTDVTFGAAYSKRSKSKDNNGYYLTAPDYFNTTGDNDGPIPEVLGVADLSFIGIDGVLAYDSLGLYNSGYYTANSAELVQNDRLGDTYEVEEKLTTVFAKFDLSAEVGDIFIRGNFGLQVVSADQSSTGFSTTTGADGYTVATPVEGGADYTDVLPTLNLSAEVADGQFVRTALAKVITRPRMDDMRPNNQASFAFNDSNINSSDINFSPWSGSAGNPELKPYEVDQFDLAYENYFADDGYIAATFFFKDIKNWHVSSPVETDFTDVYIPSYHQSSTGGAPVLFVGNVDRPVDGYTGFVRGYELQASLPFSLLADALDGFGLYASATFLDGKLDVDDGEEDRIPGLSDESYSLTLYYERGGFEFRISGTKRTDFLTEVRGGSLALTDDTDSGSELWDAQVGYDFRDSDIDWLKGLRVTLQGQNLTDEDTIKASDSDPRKINSYQAFGANYMLGLNYTF